MAKSSLRYTAEELESLGYKEVSPGRYRLVTKTKKKKKSKNNPYAHIKKGTLEIGGKTVKYRSGWEYHYCRYLEYLKSTGAIKEWYHEPKTFWFEGIKRGTVSYLPDFQVINLDGSHYWVEVKGHMTKKDQTKLKRFAKYYPEETLELVRKKEIDKIKEYLK